MKILNCLGLSGINLQCDPEPSLIKWAESVKSKRQERTVIRSSPTRSHQSKGGVENYQKQLQGLVRTMLAAMQERTQYRPTTDRALIKWIVQYAAWLIPRFRGNDAQPPSYGKLLEFGETVLASWKGIWKFRTKAGRQVEIGRVAGQKGPHERTPCPRTAGQKRTFDQSSRLHRSQGRQQQMTQLVFESFRQCHTNTTTRTSKRMRTTTRTRSTQTSQRMTTMTCRERCFRSLTQQQRHQEHRARVEERSAQKHRRMCL